MTNEINNGEIFKQKFTRIKGLSTIRRLPRLDKIRLGIKKISPKTGKEYPIETDYFVCPAKVKHFYGEKPKELHILFPVNDPEVLFPQAYKWYGSSAGLKCKGDGVTALKFDEETNQMIEKECPCELLEQGKCKQRASLVFMLPDVSISGVYQIDLSSYNSIIDINSAIDFNLCLLDGKIAMVPFILKRVPIEINKDGKKQIHYTLKLELDVSLKEAQRIREGEKVFLWQNKKYEIEPPLPDKNPALETKEDGAVIEEEIEELEPNNQDNEQATEKQKFFITKNILNSHLITEYEKLRLGKKLETATKADASEIISWWLGDKEKNIEGERAKREARGTDKKRAQAVEKEEGA